MIALWQLAFDANLTRARCVGATELIVQLILGKGSILFTLHVTGNVCAREQQSTTVLQVMSERMLQVRGHTMERRVVAHDDGLLLAENHIYCVIISNAIYSSHAGADIRIAHLCQHATVHSGIIECVAHGRVIHVVAVAHAPTAVVVGLPFVAAIEIIHFADVVHAPAIWHSMTGWTDTAIDTILPPVRTTHASETVDNQHLSFLLWCNVGR